MLGETFKLELGVPRVEVAFVCRNVIKATSITGAVKTAPVPYL